MSAPRHADESKTRSGEPSNKLEGSWSDRVEDDLEDARLEQGAQMPPISELLQEVREVEKAVEESKAQRVGAKGGVRGKGAGGVTRRSESKKPMFIDTGDRASDDEGIQQEEDDGQKTPTGKSSSSPHPEELDYQESFTSQQETAELRGEIQSLDNRLMNLESLLESLVKEREGLPVHLTRLQTDINTQLTTVMDRLHTALEKDVDPSSLKQARSDVEILTGESNKVMSQLTTDITNQPSPTSATSTKSPISTTKRRVKIIK